MPLIYNKETLEKELKEVEDKRRQLFKHFKEVEYELDDLNHQYNHLNNALYNYEQYLRELKHNQCIEELKNTLGCGVVLAIPTYDVYVGPKELKEKVYAIMKQYNQCFLEYKNHPLSEKHFITIRDVL